VTAAQQGQGDDQLALWISAHAGSRTEHNDQVSPTPRFLQLADVAEVLNISAAQVYALVRSGELPAIKIGGRGQWRVEASELESYIARMYEETRTFVSTHRFGRSDGPADEDASRSAAEEGADPS
jgi:excisionase family DNA binding protein